MDDNAPPRSRFLLSASRLRPSLRLDWSLEILVVLLVGAEAAVAYLITIALFGGVSTESHSISPVWLFLLLLLGTNIQRGIEAYRFFSPQYELISAGAVFLLLVLAIRVIAFPTRPLTDLDWPREAVHALAFPSDAVSLSAWYAIFFAGYTWWRGRTRDEPSLEAAYRTLRAGTPIAVVALIATIASTSTQTDADLRRALYGGAITFLALTLAAVALARLRVEQARGALTLTPRWLLIFLGPVASLVLIGAIVAGIFTRRFLETILWLLTPFFWLADLILLIFVYIATGIAWVIFTIVSFLLGLLGPPEPLVQPTVSAAGTPTTDPTAGITPIEYPDSVRYLFVLVIVAALVFVLTRFLWRRRPRRRPTAGEERESVFSWGLLAEGMGNLLAGLGARFRRPPDPLDALRGDPRWQHTVAIRELYQRLLRRGAEAKLPRAGDQTPDEYAPVIGTTAPPPAVTALTGRYDDARYSDQPATAEDAAAARDAWARIEKA